MVRPPIYGEPEWIGHWWAVTEDGTVVDSSWAEPGLAYVGERLVLGTKPDEDGRTLMDAYAKDGTLLEGLGVYCFHPRLIPPKGAGVPGIASAPHSFRSASVPFECRAGFGSRPAE